jgi:Tfp pilus assembly protein PilO
MKINSTALIIVVLLIIGAIIGDLLLVSKFEKKFIEVNKRRIEVANKLTTAKIVSENLNHVRDLVYKNMDFRKKGYSHENEDEFFKFLTTCVNDLKLKLISIKPERPYVQGRTVTFPYKLDMEGDFFRFGELCAKFENSRRIISVESFDVKLASEDKKNKGSSDSRRKISAQMNIKTYWIK